MRNYSTHGQSARLLYSASDGDANMLWATHFFAPDPLIFFEWKGRRHAVMSDLEIDRAKKQATVDRVLSYSRYVRRLQRQGVRFPEPSQVIAAVFEDYRIGAVEVPETFPAGVADDLRKVSVRVTIQRDPFWPDREIKTKDEVRHIGESLGIAEIGMEAGIAAVRRSRIGRDGFLRLDGTPLTSEILKRIINTTIMAEGCVPAHTIVSSGNQCVDPHNEGSGPIRAHTSIIMDIFPRSQTSGYFGDMTRTVVRGRASHRLRHAYACVLEGQNIGFREVRAGADPLKIHQNITDYFRKEGFPTGRKDGRMQGFFHGTGHGLGLDIHEPPGISFRSKQTLRRGHVVTIEPGLYYWGLGGVRLEDVVFVKETGCQNLVKYPKFLEV